MSDNANPYNPSRKELYNKWQLFAWTLEWEGSIHLSKNGYRKIGQMYFGINPRIEICSKDLILLEKMREIIPEGTIGKLREDLILKRVYYQWRITRFQELERILPLIIPYLITKQQKAKIVLEWILLRKSRKRLHYGSEEIKIYKKYKECL